MDDDPELPSVARGGCREEGEGSTHLMRASYGLDISLAKLSVIEVGINFSSQRGRPTEVRSFSKVRVRMKILVSIRPKL